VEKLSLVAVAPVGELYWEFSGEPEMGHDWLVGSMEGSAQGEGLEREWNTVSGGQMGYQGTSSSYSGWMLDCSGWIECISTLYLSCTSGCSRG